MSFESNLFKALNTIKECCRNNDACSTCPLSDGKGVCLVSPTNDRIPARWRIAISLSDDTEADEY